MMISRGSFVAAAAGFTVTACQPFRSLAQGHLQPGTLALRGAASVPFTMAGNHIFVRASLGSTAYAFIFDTGGVASIVPDVQRELSFPVVGNAHVIGVGDGSEDVELARVPELTLGGVTYRNGTFLVLPLPFLSATPFAGLPFGGILGREFFASLVTTIDYERSRLTFYERGSFRVDPSAAVLDLGESHGHPSVRAALDGHASRFVIDSGGRGGLTLTKAFAESSGIAKSFSRTIPVVIGRGVGGALVGTAARATSFALGSAVLRNPLVTVADARGGAFTETDIAGNIGGEVLRRFTLTLDVPNAKCYLRPNAHFEDPFTFNHAGLFSERRAGLETVVLVVPASPASEAGILAGDTVLKVDGADVERLASDRVDQAWQRPPGTKIDVSLRRAGKTMLATLVLRDLI